MERIGSSIRFAARATFFAYRRVPVRWRLGGGSAALTFVILAGFAAVVGVLTDRQINQQFVQQMGLAAKYLAAASHPTYDSTTNTFNCSSIVDLSGFAHADQAQVRVFDGNGNVICTQGFTGYPNVSTAAVPAGMPRFTVPYVKGDYTEAGYRVQADTIQLPHGGSGWLVYARPIADVENTINNLKLFLALGVFGGSLVALLAGLLVAQRAMRPVAQLTDVSREIERTRNPSLRLPHFEADDEVTELARTLEGMLAALDAARNESEAALARQREFVADASHELRTPLTSVLANLELLADELDGEQADSANSALRATRRMRRLVGDLLLLARADAERLQPVLPTDLGDVLTDAAAEIGPVADEHELTISAESAPLEGHADDLHRMILNLIENAIHHTPAGTQIHAHTSVEDGHPLLTVEDDGPGIPEDLQARVFERFVRGGGDTGAGPRGTGLGLAIVQAVAEAHGATLTLTSLPELPGTRFEIRFPESQTSTTTGSTIGRRRSLS